MRTALAAIQIQLLHRLGELISISYKLVFTDRRSCSEFPTN